MLKQKIGFVGGGEMARAIAQGLVLHGKTRANLLLVSDPHPPAVQLFRAAVAGCQVIEGNAALCRASQVVILAVKPQVAAEVCRELSGEVAHALVISIVAGLSLERLRAWLGTSRVVRVMPNTACLVGAGATALAGGTGASAKDLRLTEQIFSAIGIALAVGEDQLDAVTGLSGSGPAYVFSFVQGLADGGVLMGLPRATAHRLAVQTVLGAATLLRSSGEHPAEMIERVASAGGTTIHGLEALEQAGFRGNVMAAVRAATERSRAMLPPPAPTQD